MAGKRFDNEEKMGQVKRILALLYNAVYPGDEMWRFKTACRMVARGATAELALGELDDVSSRAWLAAAVKIFMMESEHGLCGWHSFSPREQTEIANAFLPAARALVDWVNGIRKSDAEDQECDWQDICFVGNAPEGIILDKLGGDEKGPDVELIKKLLFTEDDHCETIYNPLFFRQLNRGLEIDGGDIDYKEPSRKQDMQECNAVIKELYEYRAKQVGRIVEKIPTIPETSFQETIEDLVESNELYLEMARESSAVRFVRLPLQTSKPEADFTFGTTDAADEPEVGPTAKPEVREAEAEKQEPSEERPLRTETKGRFRISHYDNRVVVVDEQNNLSYTIARPGGSAAKEIFYFIKDYSAGNRQLRNSSRKLVGTFQGGRGDATRFRKEQIFMLPKWNTEKRRYVNGQYCGKWRLWTDDEMKLSPEKRLENHKKEFPDGCRWQQQPADSANRITKTGNRITNTADRITIKSENCRR